MSLFNPKIKLIGIIYKYDIDNILTVVSSPKEAMEYIRTLIAMKHFEHYVKWCDTRNLDKELDSTSEKYYNDMDLAEEEKDYNVIFLTYDKKRLAAELRNAFEYIPLGCSYEMPDEVTNYIENHKK